MNIRQPTAEDIQELSRLMDERQHLLAQMDKRFSMTNADAIKQKLDSYLIDANNVIFVAEEVHHLVGFIVGIVKPDGIGVIAEMVLDAHFYHGGLGRILVQAIRKYFEENQVNQIFALVPRYHPVEQAFWRALGTQEWKNEAWKSPPELMWMKL